MRARQIAAFGKGGSALLGGRPATTGTVNVNDAWRAEKTVCNPEFSPRFRALLTAHYVFKQPTQTTCRALGIHWAAYDHELWRAALFFWTRYQREPVEC